MKDTFRFTPIFFLMLFVTSENYSQTLPSPFDTSATISAELSLFRSDEQPELMGEDEFAYLATKGQEFAVKKDFRRSNDYFEAAYLLRLDSKERYFNRREEWYDEIHEVVILLYLKALNYLEMGNMEDALVECKRLDEWIHPQKDNDLARKLEWNDPLVHMLMALLYDFDKNYDEAWIDYHHAGEIYNAHYKNLFSKRPPRQLLLRSLALDPRFQWIDPQPGANKGELVLFWNNGRSPVEHVESQDFKIKRVDDVLLCNDSTVSFFKNVSGDTILSLFKYSRPFFSSCKLDKNYEQETCELLEDLTWFSVRKTCERLRHKGVHVWRQGRGWSTMPGSIYYAVVPLSEGQNNFTFTMRGDRGASRKETFSVPGDGRSHFHTITTLESVCVAQPVARNLLTLIGANRFDIIYTGEYYYSGTSNSPNFMGSSVYHETFWSHKK